MRDTRSVPEKIRSALEGAAEQYMTVDEIARAVFGHTNERNRSAVYLAVHRMENVETRPKGYRLKQPKAGRKA